MLQKLCRLCLNSDRLIYMFDSRLKTHEQLLSCVELCTGVEIKQSDEISKFVCNSCCTIAVKLFKFRRNAIANDKALKEHAGQKYEEPLTSKDDIIKFNNSLVNSIEKFVQESPSVPLVPQSPSVVACVPPKTNGAVHPSIIRLFKLYERLIIPNELLQYDIDPTLVLDRIPDPVVNCDDDDLDDDFNNGFDDYPTSELDEVRKKLPPGLNIVKVPADVPAVKSLNSAEVNNRAASEAGRKRHRLNSDSPEVIPEKKKRVFAKEDKSLHKIELPEKSPSDIQSKKMIFTSSLELTTSEMTNVTKSAAPVEEIVINDEPISGEDEGGFLKPLNNLDVVVCPTCNRVYTSESQLKIHMKRMHNKCIVCHRPHENQTRNFVRLKKFCRNYIEENQPRLVLTRAEDVQEIVEKYFDAFSKDIDDIFESTAAARESALDYEYLETVFKRYRGHRTPREGKCVQTYEPDLTTRVGQQGSLKLPIAYSDLLFYKIPVSWEPAQKMSAAVSYTNKPKPYTKVTDWNSLDVIDLTPGKKKAELSKRVYIDNLITLNDQVLQTSSIKTKPKPVIIAGAAAAGSIKILNVSAPNSISIAQPLVTVSSNSLSNNVGNARAFVNNSIANSQAFVTVSGIAANSLVNIPTNNVTNIQPSNTRTYLAVSNNSGNSLSNNAGNSRQFKIVSSNAANSTKFVTSSNVTNLQVNNVNNTQSFVTVSTAKPQTFVAVSSNVANLQANHLGNTPTFVTVSENFDSSASKNVGGNMQTFVTGGNTSGNQLGITKVQTSNVPVTNNNKYVLRVKSPWELNKIS